MDQSSQTSERLTAILSTLIALAILSVGVTAQQTRSARPDELNYLESDLRFQLEAAYRLNPKAGEERLAQLELVLAAWRQAPRTETDRRLLSTWLLEATIRSMPGSLEPLPPPPQFGAPQPPAESPPSETEAEPLALDPNSSGKNLDIAEEPAVPFVPGLTPDLAPSQQPAPALASTPVESTLVSVGAPKAPAEPEPAAPLVEINLTELAARIAGYHQGLNELESILLANERPGADDLAGQIDILDGLAKDFQFVELYYATLSEEERQAVKPPRSLGPVLAILRRHLDRLRSNADGDFLGEFDAALGEKVAQLRGQLDAIAARAVW